MSSNLIQFKEITYGGNKYYLVPSNNIQVSPCSSRKYGVKDSESRMQTELTLTNRYPKGLQGMKNYIIGLTQSTVDGDSQDAVLEFSIGGYYFKITGLTTQMVDGVPTILDLAGIPYTGEYNLYGIITLEDWDIFGRVVGTNSGEHKSKRLTTIIPVEGTYDSLDITDVEESSTNPCYFYGFGFYNNPTGSSSLNICDKSGVLTAANQLKFDVSQTETVGSKDSPIYKKDGALKPINLDITNVQEGVSEHTGIVVGTQRLENGNPKYTDLEIKSLTKSIAVGSGELINNLATDTTGVITIEKRNLALSDNDSSLDQAQLQVDGVTGTVTGLAETDTPAFRGLTVTGDDDTQSSISSVGRATTGKLSLTSTSATLQVVRPDTENLGENPSIELSRPYGNNTPSVTRVHSGDALVIDTAHKTGSSDDSITINNTGTTSIQGAKQVDIKAGWLQTDSRQSNTTTTEGLAKLNLQPALDHEQGEAPTVSALWQASYTKDVTADDDSIISEDHRTANIQLLTNDHNNPAIQLNVNKITQPSAGATETTKQISLQAGGIDEGDGFGFYAEVADSSDTGAKAQIKATTKGAAIVFRDGVDEATSHVGPFMAVGEGLDTQNNNNFAIVAGIDGEHLPTTNSLWIKENSVEVHGQSTAGVQINTNLLDVFETGFNAAQVRYATRASVVLPNASTIGITHNLSITKKGTGTNTYYCVNGPASKPVGPYSIIIPEQICDDDNADKTCYPVKEINENAFSIYGEEDISAYLQEIDLPDTITKIGIGAFKNCKAINTISIPANAVELGNEVFWGCTGLQSIYIKGTETGSSASTFTGCTGLKIVYGPWSTVTKIVKSSYAPAIKVCITDKEEVIYTSATFTGCTNITDVVLLLPSETELPEKAFEGCKQLRSLYYATNLTFGYKCFDGCTNLNTISYGDSLENWLAQTNNNLQGLMECSTDKQLIISGTLVTDLAIPEPESGIRIPAYAFYGCSSLTSVNFPWVVTNIGTHAFSYCRSLTSFTGNSQTDPRSQTYFVDTNARCVLGGQDGQNYTKLVLGCNKSNLSMLPSSVTKIDSYALVGCDFTEISIPKQIAQVENSAIVNCAQLKSISMHADIAKSILGSCGANDLVVTLTKCSATALKLQNNTNIKELCITDADNGINLGSFALSGCTNLKKVKISKLLSLGTNVWDSDPQLGSVIIENWDSSITILPDCTFKDCKNLYQVNIEAANSISKIGQSAFAGCKSLQLLRLPDSVEHIGSVAFSGCSSLDTIYIGPSIKSIYYLGSSSPYANANAFNKCSSLKAIIINTEATATIKAYEGASDAWVAPDGAEVIYRKTINCGTI